MHKEITLFGESSKQQYVLKLKTENLDQILMNFLRERNIPIASSCSGEGVCRKCVVTKNILSCSLTVRDYLKNHGQLVSVSYL